MKAILILEAQSYIYGTNLADGNSYRKNPGTDATTDNLSFLERNKKVDSIEFLYVGHQNTVYDFYSIANLICLLPLHVFLGINIDGKSFC